MIYTYKSKHNLEELKKKLQDYLYNLMKDVTPVRPQSAGYPLEHLFTGINLQTGERHTFRIKYDCTEKWSSRPFHVFTVEMLSVRCNQWIEF
ncbi:hypothetical protein [Paenibacillus terreus]|uniref:hypothetical protein n=1 Tax=Paenibacillus terreus TaxID=1387834 RepID=UPI0035CCF6CE